MAPQLLEIHCSREEGLSITIKPSTWGLLSESTRGHLRAANKELLMALRSVIDSAIEYTEEKQQRARRPRHIQVRVGDAPAEDNAEQQ